MAFSPFRLSWFIKNWFAVAAVPSVILFIFILSSFRLKVKMFYPKFTKTHFKTFQQTAGIRTTGVSSKINEKCYSSADWDTILHADSLSGYELLQYFMWSNSSSCNLSHDFGGQLGKNPTGIAGQKAICIDSRVAPQPGKCLVYSFGINKEWSFDEHMELYGCEVFAFDPSMGMENHDHSPGIHFYNLGLSNRDEYNIYENWTMRSLLSIYGSLSARHGHKIIDYLKIDIEFYEWIALPQIMESGMLSKIRQLGIEVHLDHTDDIEWYRGWAKILRKMEKMGMIRFDSKYNPWSFGNFTELQLLGSFGYEIAWYNENLLHR
ncbi:hypothetical protein OUZ56_011865 [Daphnia magna]|uniref:Methyltransferase domain-containing protein n=1 Tax=Daphnia magna TaxID=35525 RepID=A0ABQ9Z1D3_9CRUS|nr:hypothetical protein OUZ56_011865 [Daphnia magna]